jgi:hypothetical protein
VLLWRLNAEDEADSIFTMEDRNNKCIKYENSCKETRQEALTHMGCQYEKEFR